MGNIYSTSGVENSDQTENPGQYLEYLPKNFIPIEQDLDSDPLSIKRANKNIDEFNQEIIDQIISGSL